MTARRIAVTVVGGYLGAGKTTLVNHVLSRAPSDERIAVLVNDFGAINVDASLIAARSDNTIELANGCICCSVVDGFAEALDRVRELEPTPDRLLIECSGVADPGTVAAYGHGTGLELDAVVVLVDAETVRNQAGDRRIGDTIVRQLDAAHVIVLNKVDLVPDELDAIDDWLRHGWPDAVVVHTRDAVVDDAVLFGHHVLARDPGQPFEPPSYSTDVIECGAVDRAWVETKMTSLPDATVRAKGLVALVDDDRPYVLQRVGVRWTLRPSRDPWPADPATRIVVIGLADAD